MTMSLIDIDTIDKFSDLALSQPESLWIEEVLDKVLPLSLLDIGAQDSSSISENVNAIHALLSAKHSSWESFVLFVQQYDNSLTCGLVWTKNYYAYRCRTCAISQCMSLCEDCFKAGNHEGHDFNLFRSGSGGACDCGDPDVMKPLGFCCKHGERNAAKLPSAPPELVATARVVLPRLLLLLTLHMRRNYRVVEDCMTGAGWLFSLLKDITNLGASMLSILCSALTDERLYSNTLATRSRTAYTGADCDAVLTSLADCYQTAMNQLPSVLPDDGSVELGGVPIVERLHHGSLLDELTFWMVQTRFPQPLIGLLLAVLPIRAYKAQFAAAFAAHYLRVVSVLCSSDKPPLSGGASAYQANLSYRVMHISVQLLSAAGLCQHMCERHALLERVLIGLDYVLAASGQQPGTVAYRPAGLDGPPVPAQVEHPIMMEHRYWPVVSDLVNMLVHQPVAMRLLGSEGLLAHYTAMLGRLHLANASSRVAVAALEFDTSRAYYSAFAADNEIAACPLWTLWTWAKSDPRLALAVLRSASSIVRSGFLDCDYVDSRLSFHLPVHRLVSAFICALSEATGSSSGDCLTSRIAELISPINDFLLPPLRALIGYCEIGAELWLRNGLQMKGQAMTYVHTSFCCSLVDLDLHLVQTGVALLPDRAETVRCLFRLLHLEELASLRSGAGDNAFIGPDNEERAAAMAELGLQFLAWLLCLYPANGLARDPAGQLERELIVAACVEDRTHSQLVDNLPDRDSAHYEPGRQSAALQPALERVAELSTTPSSATAATTSSSASSVDVLVAPVYRPRPEVWLHSYDPLMTSLRCHHRRHHQAGLDRYSRFLVTSGEAIAKANDDSDEGERQRRHRRDFHAWPPYRLPGCWIGEGEGEGELPAYLAGLTDILHTSAMHSRLLALLYKFVHNQQPIRSGTLSLIVFLFELALTVPRRDASTECYTVDPETDCNFASHDLRVNLCHEVTLPPCQQESSQTVSLLSLLLTAHRQLSDGANPTLSQLSHCRVTSQCRVGEGRDFLRRVISLACPPGTDNYARLRAMLGFSGDSPAVVAKVSASADDRRSAVEERKRKLMERMVAQQRAFAASLQPSSQQQLEAGSADTAEPSAMDVDESAECCICQKSSSDTVAASPFAFLALAQPSSILAHRTCQSASARRLSAMLEASHWAEALTELRWGVVVTSCGHCVHSDCVLPYISGLDQQARLFPCPLCRQTFNLVLPLCPGVTWEGPRNLQTPLLRDADAAADAAADNLAQPVQTASGKLLSLAQLWSPAPPPMEDHERWSFWAGILLTNLRLELCLIDMRDSRLHAKFLTKCCTGRLLRFLMRKAAYELCRRESSAFLTAFLDHFMTGASAAAAAAGASEEDADEWDAPFQPLLLQDPGKMLVLLVLTAVCKKQQWYAALAAAYNLAYVQALLAELLSATEQEKRAWSQQQQPSIRGEEPLLFEHARLILKHAEPLLRQAATSRQPQLSEPPPPPRSPAQLSSRLESRLVPLLRLAALLLGHVTRSPPLPPPPPLAAFSDLCHRLGLCQQQQQQQTAEACLSGASASCRGCSPARLFTPLDAAGLDSLAAAWIAAVTPPQRRPIACLIDRLALPSELRPPRLISLPPTYDAVFSANRSRTCRHCSQHPAHPAVCLVCGEFLCFNSNCCQAKHGEDTVGECHRHSVLCGAGVCLLLAVDSSFVWVFTHGQALRWGSLYVDEFGEEDEELRRGKPLYLSRQRYETLESQWLLHNYYSSVPRPVWPSHSL